MAGKYLRGGIWWITWQSAKGRHRLSTGKHSEREAEVLRRAKELELEIGRPIIVDDSAAPTVEELSVLFLEHQERAVSSAYRNKQSMLHILPAFGTTRLTSLTKQAIKSWLMDRLEVAARGTVRRDLATLRRMLNLAVEWELLPTNPAARIRVPGVDDTEGQVSWYSTEQLAALYEDPELGVVWKLYANTGIRRNEGLQVKRADLQEDRMYVVSRTGSLTKSRRSRVVPLNASARDAIKALGGDGPYLLPRLHPHTLTHYFTAYARSADLPGNLHWLRHSFGHHWVRTGRSLRQLQLIMGHASYSTTERYARLDTGDLDITGFEV